VYGQPTDGSQPISPLAMWKWLSEPEPGGLSIPGAARVPQYN